MRSAIFFLQLLFILAALASSAPAAAQEFVRGSRSGGMGEAGTAAASVNGAISVNPAGIAREVSYAVDTGYARTPTGNVLSASVVDSQTNPSISAGVGYSFLSGHGSFDDFSAHEIRLGIALPVMPEQISFGVGGRYLIAEKDGVELLNGLTLDAGAMFRLGDVLHFALVGRNLIDQCTRPECSTLAPLEVGGGFAFGGAEALTVVADVIVELSSDEPAPSYRIGTEYVIQEAVPVRAGFYYRSLTSSGHITGGLGWRSSDAGLDSAFQINPADPEQWQLQVAMSIFL
jgi:long-subunit fatty acid transport protein